MKSNLKEENRHSLRYAWHAASFDQGIASVRIRCLQVMNALDSLGVSVEKYDPVCKDTYEAVVFSKSYREQDLELAGELLMKGVKVIFDICDNHFYIEKATRKIDQRVVRLEKMLFLSTAVVCSTETLRRQVLERWPELWRKISVIADMLDDGPFLSPTKRTLFDNINMLRFRKFVDKNHNSLKLIWFGNHGVNQARSGMNDLSCLEDFLHEFNVDHPVSLTIVSNSFSKYLTIFKNWRIPTIYIPWSNSTFGEILSTHSVAIIPIGGNPFTAAKTINRPSTAISMGLGVVADSIPSYEELRPFMWLGDWREALLSYKYNFDFEYKRIANGKDYLRKAYSAEAIGQNWRNLLFSDLILN